MREAVLSFAGDYMQVPPMYSALKVERKETVRSRKGGRDGGASGKTGADLFTIEITRMVLPPRVLHACALLQRELISALYVRTSVRNLPAAACMESLAPHAGV